MAEKQRSIAEFIQSPDSMSVEQFLATRPLGRLVHRVLGAVVRECSTHSTSELKILEIGSRHRGLCGLRGYRGDERIRAR